MTPEDQLLHGDIAHSCGNRISNINLWHKNEHADWAACQGKAYLLVLMYTALKASCSCDMSNKPFTVPITPCTCHIHPCNLLSLYCHCAAVMLSRLGASHAASQDNDQQCMRSGSLLEGHLSSIQQKHLTWVTALAQQLASKCNGLHMSTSLRLTQAAALGIAFLVPGTTLNQLRLELQTRLARLPCSTPCCNCMNV